MNPLIKLAPNKRYQKRLNNARHPLDFFALSDSEKKFIITTANKRKLPLHLLDLPDLDFAAMAVRQEGLFTFCYLKVKDEDGAVLLKVGVTKRNTKYKQDAELAARIALWRAVLAPPVVIET